MAEQLKASHRFLRFRPRRWWSLKDWRAAKKTERFINYLLNREKEKWSNLKQEL